MISYNTLMSYRKDIYFSNLDGMDQISSKSLEEDIDIIFSSAAKVNPNYAEFEYTTEPNYSLFNVTILRSMHGVVIIREDIHTGGKFVIMADNNYIQTISNATHRLHNKESLVNQILRDIKKAAEKLKKRN